MHQIEHKILTQFQKNPHQEFSTTDIIISACQEEYNSISSALLSHDLKKCKTAMQDKGQLHRNII
jgi:hypothetical protein